MAKPESHSTDPATAPADQVFVTLKMRTRFRRALRWPVMLRRFKRVGVSWRQAWQLTHSVVWFQPRPHTYGQFGSAPISPAVAGTPGERGADS